MKKDNKLILVFFLGTFVLSVLFATFSLMGLNTPTMLLMVFSIVLCVLFTLAASNGFDNRHASKFWAFGITLLPLIFFGLIWELSRKNSVIFVICGVIYIYSCWKLRLFVRCRTFLSEGERIVFINKETKDLEQTAWVKKIGFFDICLEFENRKVEKTSLEVFFRESGFFVIQEVDKGSDKSSSKA